MLILVAACSGPAVAADFFTLKGHGGPVRGIDVGPDGAIMTASFDNSVGLWRDGAPLWMEAHRAGVNVVAFVDARRALSAGDDFDVYLWDLETGSGRRLAGHKGKVQGVAVSPDLHWAASASWDGSIGIWDLTAPETPPRFLQGHRSGVNDVVFSADGTQLYSGASDGAVWVWDLATGDQARRLVNNGFAVTRVVVDEAAGWLAYGAVDGVTRVLDLESGALVKDITLGRRPILALAHGAGLLGIGDGEGYISLFNTEDWSLRSDFRATLRGPVWALHFSADGQSILAGGLDTALYSWPLDGLKDAQRMVAELPSYLKKPEDQSNGERQYNRKCSICHALGPDGERRAGPTLYQIFGRPAGTLEGYPYSQTLRSSDVVWDATSIDALFDHGPDTYITGSKMPEQRITDPKDRRDLIEFLQTATTEGEP